MTLTFDDIQFQNAAIVTTDTEGGGAITLGGVVAGYGPFIDTAPGMYTYIWVRSADLYEMLRVTIDTGVATVEETIQSSTGVKIVWAAGEKTVAAATPAEVFELIKTALLGKQAALTFGIADTNAVQIDDAAAAATEYARLTATGIEGRSAAEARGDLSLDTDDDVTFNSVTTGAGIDTVDTEYTIVETKDDNDDVVSRITVEFDNLTSGTQNGVMRIYVMLAGALTCVLEVDGE